MFEFDSIEQPSEHIVAQAEKLWIADEVLMRDFLVTGQYDIGGQPASIAVGDMANSYVSQTFEWPELAGRYEEVPDDFEWGIGSIGSSVLAEFLAQTTDSGLALVEGANQALLDMYVQLGLVESAEQGADFDPLQRSIGYFAHAAIGPEVTRLTAVGEVMGWVNGEHVVGLNEKAIDTTKNEFIYEVAAAGNYSRALDMLRELGGTFMVDRDDLAEIARNFAAVDWSQHENVPYEDFRQMIYQAANNSLTHWQIRDLQNQLVVPRGSAEIRGDLYYGAIDGTRTPEQFIHTFEIPTRDIDTLVLATDGLRSEEPGAEIIDIEQLVPIDPRFGEQTAIGMYRA